MMIFPNESYVIYMVKFKIRSDPLKKEKLYPKQN